MQEAEVPQREQWDYLKWLRYYLDFCSKYRHAPRDDDSLAPLLEKLSSKNQSLDRQRQAAKAVGLYYDLVKRWADGREADPLKSQGGARGQPEGPQTRDPCHTFRYSFASHLLQANYDTRTIQQLMGHSDVRTTMIYTHTVESRTIEEVASPLDLDVA